MKPTTPAEARELRKSTAGRAGQDSAADAPSTTTIRTA